MNIDHEAFRAAYSRFLAPPRILLTGHSHQAWPDVVRDALTQAFDDAATFVDDKWGQAVFPKVDRVGRAVLRRMGFDEDDSIAFGRSTQELLMRLLSALGPLGKARIVTTGAEFHSMRRQLGRLAEEGVPITWVDSDDRASLADRLFDAMVPGTRLVAFSAVLFEDARIVHRIDDLLVRAQELGAVALVDAYHAFNTVPLAWGPAKSTAYVLGGGYKYAQFGEGLCFMRFPKDSSLRPVDTGWFADFAALDAPRTTRGPSEPTGYGPGGQRFAGSTFDPTPFYRAEAVLTHFDRAGLDVPTLRAISLAQTQRILDGLDAKGLGDRVQTPREDALRGGFVALSAPATGPLVAALRARGVWVDARGNLLRLGPAPYLRDDEIERAVAIVADTLLEAQSF